MSMAYGKLGSEREMFKIFNHVKSFLGHFQTINFESVSISNYSCMRN